MLRLIHRLKSDEALMLAYQRGDSTAFDCLYHRHKDGLFAFLYRSCPRQAVVEELAQDAWVAVINAAARYQPQASFRTWLYQIARNRLVDFWRARDNAHQPLDTAPEPNFDPGADSGPDIQQRLMVAMGELAVEQRTALLLQEQGFSLGEIAEITGDGKETVKSRLRYARKQLLQQLGGEE
jgi:RNA polymerase sigma-70 factor, ECF subfamily